MVYSVVLKNAVKKNLRKLPLMFSNGLKLWRFCSGDGRPTGPHNWSNYGKLGENKISLSFNLSHYVRLLRNEKGTLIII